MMGNVRRVRLRKIGAPVKQMFVRRFRQGNPASRLRPADRATYRALEQIHEGVPLNWTQVEDDPALQALALLSENQELVGERGAPMPGALHDEVYNRLAARLPAPKPQPKKEAPKPLAGFSENVPVLTQAEDDLPRSSPALPLIAAAVAVVLIAAVLLGGFNALGGNSSARPTFSWIDVRVNGVQASDTRHPTDWQMPACRGYKIDDPNIQRDFNMIVPYSDQAQQYVGFKINFLPATLPISPTYAFKLLDAAISPCSSDAPDATDAGAMLRMSYSARQNEQNGATLTGSMVVFQGKSVPLPVNLSSGDWKEFKVGQAHAVYWHGGPYHDIEGTNWIGDISVMAVESGNDVSLLVGAVEGGITEDMLTALVENMQR